MLRIIRLKMNWKAIWNIWKFQNEPDSMSNLSLAKLFSQNKHLIFIRNMSIFAFEV